MLDTINDHFIVCGYGGIGNIDTPIRAGDRLVVLDRPDSLKQLESEASR